MKSLSNMTRLNVPNDLLMDLIKLYQYRGKDFFYEDVMRSNMDYIIKQTVEREAYFLSKRLHLEITDNRTRLIIKKDANPKTKDEQILSNLKEVFKILQDKAENFELTTNEIQSMARKIYAKVKDINFNSTYEEVQINLLREKQKTSKRKKLEELLELYSRMLDHGDIEITQLVTNFFVDFVNMDIFTEENETIGVVLMYALLFRERFNLFRYSSFFEMLYNNGEAFNQACLSANYNWEDGFAQTTSLNRLLIKMMLTGYDKIENMVRDFKYDLGLNKSDNIENTISKLPDVFTKDEIRAKHPYVSESTINRTLQRLRDEGKIRPNGVGRSATWIRLINQERFDPDFRQMDLFEFVLDPDDKLHI